MNKLYPQVLRAEQNIQELKGQLRVAEGEGYGRQGQLAEADQQVLRLHGQLSQIEGEQLELTHELRQVEHESGEFREALRKASQDREELRDMLRKSEADFRNGLDMLALAERISREERERIVLAKHDIHGCTNRLTSATGEGQKLRATLDHVELQGSGLQEELACSSEVDVAQRKHLKIFQEQHAFQEFRGRQTEAECRDLRRQVAELEHLGQDTGMRLTDAELTVKQNHEHREQLLALGQESRKLDLRVVHIVRRITDTQEAVGQVEQESLVLHARICELEEAHGEVQEQLDEAERRRHASRTILTEHQTDCDDLDRRLRKVEHDCASKEDMLSEEVRTMSMAADVLKVHVSELESESSILLRGNDECADDNTSMQAKLDILEDAIAELRAKSADLRRGAAELRQKPACSCCLA